MADIREFIASLTDEETQELVKEAIAALPHEHVCNTIAHALNSEHREELRDKLDDLLLDEEDEEDNDDGIEDDEE